eukprot:scaffold34589_cov163-Skeletonema_dohrnii-CCMP3373.AAC.7
MMEKAFCTHLLTAKTCQKCGLFCRCPSSIFAAVNSMKGERYDMRWGHYNRKENDTRAAANAEPKNGRYNRFHSMVWQVNHPNTSCKISLHQSASNKTQKDCLPQFYGAVGCRWDCQLRFCLFIFADHRLCWNVIFVIIYMDCHAVCCRRKGVGVTLWFGACGLVVVGWSVVLACFGLADRKMDRGQRCRGTDSYRRTTSILNRPAAFGLWCVCEGLSCWMSVRAVPKKGLYVHAPRWPPANMKARRQKRGRSMKGKSRAAIQN